jgi:uncharacterized protein YjgD (DUF1641 family)
VSTVVAEDRLAALDAKLDQVSHQLDYVADALREQELRRGSWDELRRDLAPLTSEAVAHLSRELDDVRAFVQPHDLFRMLKRLLRNLPYLEALLDQVESLSQLGADLGPLGREVVLAAMKALGDLDHKGYFAFARGARPVLDRAVASLGPEDWQALAESIPGAVGTLRELAHPDTLDMLRRVAAQLHRAPAEDKGLLKLLWHLRRPQARRGLSRLLGLLDALGGTAAAGPDSRFDH